MKNKKKQKTEEEFEEEQAKIKEANAPFNEGIRAGRGLVSNLPMETNETSTFMGKLIRQSLTPKDFGLEAGEDGLPVRNEDGTFKKVVPAGDAGAGTGVLPQKGKLSQSDKIRKVANQNKINLEDL